MAMPENYNHILGGEFEQAARHLLCEMFGISYYDLGKPDYVDYETGTFYECKCTRPYYEEYTDVKKDTPGADLGSGLIRGQFERYVKGFRNHGFNIVFVHAFTQGRYAGEIIKFKKNDGKTGYKWKGAVFYTPLTEELIENAEPSKDGKTVWWKYKYLIGTTENMEMLRKQKEADEKVKELDEIIRKIFGEKIAEEHQLATGTYDDEVPF